MASTQLGALPEESTITTTTSSTNEPTTEPSTNDQPIVVPVVMKEIETVKYGKVKVYIQGDLQEKEKKAVFLTVHDIGSNHSSIRDFVEKPCMSEIKARSIFIHLDIPGQEDGADDLPDDFTFPSIQQMGEELIPTVLDHLKVGLIVGIGEGAGANVLVRFALANPTRTLGIMLIHLVTAGVGMLEKLKDSFFTGKRRPSEAFQQPDQVIALHKFGGTGNSSGSVEDNLLSDTKSRVANINPKNLRKYVEAYMNRKDITDKLSGMNNMDILLVAGGKSPYMQGVITIYGKMDKSKTSLLKIDGVVDVMQEASDKLAKSLLLFVKGLGFLTSLTLPGVERQRTMSGESQEGAAPLSRAALGAIGRRRTLSMEEYDLPRPRRLSLTTAGISASPAK
ncbi:uncharacterized protein ZK1073.1 isoform X1 [Tetranychus urticae]|uniref:uncharacterized protein ZK1073.1 isoform X1 n=1 Tax=Tetranychus urticae TaxID=32264 RepID=UPI00077BDD28|nr:uncharacterized protein ZK1073.1 isoform X1 [Tetranychus urticae]